MEALKFARRRFRSLELLFGTYGYMIELCILISVKLLLQKTYQTLRMVGSCFLNWSFSGQKAIVNSVPDCLHPVVVVSILFLQRKAHKT
jgi:hypothetical protein